MIKTKEVPSSQKSQPDLITRVIALYNELMGLRRTGILITQQQKQLREYLKVLTLTLTGTDFTNGTSRHNIA